VGLDLVFPRRRGSVQDRGWGRGDFGSARRRRTATIQLPRKVSSKQGTPWKTPTFRSWWWGFLILNSFVGATGALLLSYSDLASSPVTVIRCVARVHAVRAESQMAHTWGLPLARVTADAPTFRARRGLSYLYPPAPLLPCPPMTALVCFLLEKQTQQRKFNFPGRPLYL